MTDRPTLAEHDPLSIPDGPPPGHEQPGIRGVLIPVVLGLVIGSIFVTVFLAAFHAPSPHGLRVGVVGPATQVSAVAGALQSAQPDAFAVQGYPDAASARAAIERRDVLGAYLPAEGRLLVAGANGGATTQALSGAIRHIDPSGDLVVDDVLPTSPRDSASLSTFYAAFGVVLAGFLFGEISTSVAPRLSLGRRLASIGLFSLLSGTVVALVAGSIGFGALPGNIALLGLLVGLLAAAVASATVAIIRLTGPAGNLIAAVLLLIVGNAAGGGTLPVAFLPPWLQPFSAILPVGVGIRALKGTSYFDGDGVVLGIVVLVVWIAVSIGLLVLKDLLTQRRAATAAADAGRAVTA